MTTAEKKCPVVLLPKRPWYERVAEEVGAHCHLAKHRLVNWWRRTVTYRGEKIARCHHCGGVFPVAEMTVIDLPDDGFAFGDRECQVFENILNVIRRVGALHK
jgi:hypothetical protein